ncbi:MAG: hypothetical protein QM723_02810 [Myxococcaceae bacterium]
MLALLASLAVLAAPAKCSPEGLYEGVVGDGPPSFFTRFSGQGRWDSYTRLDAKPFWGGPYFQDADGTIRFKLESDGETNYPYAATFQSDCSGLVLKMAGGQTIRFKRIPEPKH